MGDNRSRARLRACIGTAVVAAAAILVSGAAGKPGDGDRQKLDKIQHIVVVYEENHSFDNLYGGWEAVNGRANADAAHTIQIGQGGQSGQGGVAYQCLLQNDVNLASQ